jgi:PAB1-binding protein PBP1
VEKAIRIEREIKHQTTSNSHLAEERGIVAPKDDTEDEEDKYVLPVLVAVGGD